MKTAQQCREALERSPLYQRREYEAMVAHQIAKLRAWEYREDESDRLEIRFRIIEVRA
jgi:hypothetical protein